MLAGQKLRCLFQRAADVKQKGHNHAANEERHAPAPGLHVGGREIGVQPKAQNGREHDGHLLAAGLPGDIEAFVAGGRDLGQINRNTTQLDACREALKQAANEHQQGCGESNGFVIGHKRNQDCAKGHEAQRGDEALATPDAVHVSAEKNRTQRAHQESGPKRHERQHQGCKFGIAGKKRL